jgi:hypothetical protein
MTDIEEGEKECNVIDIKYGSPYDENKKSYGFDLSQIIKILFSFNFE